MPSGAVLLHFSTDEGTVVETIDPAIAPGLSFHGYGEFSAIARTGLVVANTTAQSATVNVELRTLTGALRDTAQIVLPPLGQETSLLDDLPGIDGAGAFQGSVQVTSTTPIAVTLIRTLTNARGDFLIASIPPDNVADVSAAAESFFPLFALGGGAEMEFVLLNSQISRSQSGDLLFFAADGRQFLLQ